MKLLVTGVSGQLGHDVMNEAAGRGWQATGSDLAPAYAGVQDASPVTAMPYVQLDITDEQAVFAAVREERPEVIVHCAAWTAVDAAEDPANQEKVRRINAGGTRSLALAAREVGAKFIYLSTDYIFDGTGTEPWACDCTSYAPLNFYGQTKLEGELAVKEILEKYFIVRIAWVFGRSGHNFIKTMLKVGKTHPQLRVVQDQVGTPTYTYDLARLLLDMADTDRYGVYHATNEGGYISWYDFTLEIFRQAAALGHEEYAEISVQPVTTSEYGLSAAARPFNSRLDRSKLREMGFTPLPDWRDALGRYLREEALWQEL